MTDLYVFDSLVHSYVTTLCLIGTGVGVVLQQDHGSEFLQDEAVGHLWSQPDGVGCNVEHCQSQVSLKGNTSTKKHLLLLLMVKNILIQGFRRYC